MVVALCKGQCLLRSVVNIRVRPRCFNSRVKDDSGSQKWGKFFTKYLTLGAGGVGLASVVFLAQAARDNNTCGGEGTGTNAQCTCSNNTAKVEPSRVTGGECGEGNNERKTFQSAIIQSRDLIQRIKDESGSPGIVIGVSVDGKTVWSEGLGYADLENRTRITPSTVIRIASISKSITMAIVAKLWESDKLDIDAPVQKYVPDFPQKEVDGEKVTITTRQLVSHLSGIRHYEKNPKKSKKDKKQGTKDKENKKSEAKNNNNNKISVNAEGDERFKEFYLKKKFPSTKAALELFKNDPLIHKPGSQYLYTTHGWTLVSAVLEGASGEPFPKLLTGLFKKLGMTNTYLDEAEPLIYHRARHYAKNKKGRIVNAPYVDNSYKWAGGGLLSTVGDLLRFGNVMLYSFQWDAENSQVQGESKLIDSNSNSNINTKENGSSSLPGYLKQDTVRKLWTVVETTRSSSEALGGYGMGWSVFPESLKHGCCEHQKYFVSHTGGAMGASSVLLVYPCSKTRQGQGHMRGQVKGLQENGGEKQDVNANNPNGQSHKKRQAEYLGEMDFVKEKRLPQGITVAIIANLSAVGSRHTALRIAQIFENADR